MSRAETCRLAVAVQSPDEARRALEAGADYVLAPARRERPHLSVSDRRPENPVDLHFAMAGDASLPAEPLRVARLREAESVKLLGEGQFAAALLDPERALLRTYSLEVLAAFQAQCRAAGLQAWFGGQLELPDIPRLLVLQPDALVFEDLNSETMRLARSMLAPSPAPAVDANAEIDRIFVRGFTVPFRIGAYGFERERTQRVRFSVEAEIRRPAVTPRHVGDVYSYDVVTDAIRRLAERGHNDLVEALAEDLAVELLRDERLLSVDISVEKLDLGPDAVGVRILRRQRQPFV